MKQDVLYHYTCKMHLNSILSAGYLKLTNSNLLPPQDIRFVNNCDYKPVVWLTDSIEPEENGLEGSILDKKEIKITVKKQSYCKFWKLWSKNNKIDKQWAKELEKGYNSSSWFISEQPINMDDIIKIENRYTGEVYYKQ